MPHPDYTGKRFGKLTVTRFDRKAGGVNYWECLCDCGNTIVAKGCVLKARLILSCGCQVSKLDLTTKEPAALVAVGQKVEFDPFLTATGFASDDYRGNYITGKVVLVNDRHKWFSVEYGYPKMRTSFKFCDIGETVMLQK